MIKAIITDLSQVLLFAVDEHYTGKLNDLHEKLLKSGDYNFWKYFRINEELLTFYQELSPKIDLYLFTTEYIQEYPPLKQQLDGIFERILSAAQIGEKKNDPKAYLELAKIIQIQPNQILFIDDYQKNLDAAEKAGMLTLQYETNENLIGHIKGALEDSRHK